MKRISRAVFAPQSSGGGYAWTWPNAQARTAQSVSAADVGKVGYQTDLGRSYECVATSGVVWGEQYDSKWGVPRVSYWTNDAWEEGVNYMSGVGASVMGRSNIAPTNRSESYKYGCINVVSGAYYSVYTDGVRNGGNRYTYGIRYRGMILQRATGDGAAASTWWFGSSNTIPGVAVSTAPPLSFVVGRMGGSANLIVRSMGTLVTDVQDIDLGANFPGSLLGEGYDIEVYSLDGTAFAYSVTRVNTGHCASGVVSSGFRPDATSLAMGGWHLNGSQPYISLVYFARWARGGARL
jgi:hypothetical protein